MIARNAEINKYQDILLVEDEQDLGMMLSQYLRFKGISVHWSFSAEAALASYELHVFRLVIIDIQLPEMDGFALAREIQEKQPQQAFFFLTAQYERESRLKGFALGAIDYIGKPFEMEELLLKIKNFLRLGLSNSTTEPLPSAGRLGRLTFYRERMLLIEETGKQHKLTVRETEILGLLISRQNQLVQKKELLLRFWGNTDYFNGKSLEVFISRIRKLLSTEADIRIENIYGAGYILLVEGAALQT